jgi:hypothetical protein
MFCIVTDGDIGRAVRQDFAMRAGGEESRSFGPFPPGRGSRERIRF